MDGRKKRRERKGRGRDWVKKAVRRREKRERGNEWKKRMRYTEGE